MIQQDKLRRAIIPVALAIFMGCGLPSCKTDNDPTLDADGLDIKQLKISPTFDYNTTQTVSITVQGQDRAGNPLQMDWVEIYSPLNSGELLASGRTDAQGRFSISQTIPSHVKELLILSHCMGVPDTLRVPVESGQVSATFAPVTAASGGRIQALVSGARMDVSGFAYMGTYTSAGVPSYLMKPNDVIDAQFLNDLNATLPENRPVPTYNPQYLAQGNSTDIKLSEEADVWITFIHEGAGWRNALGYYTYPLNAAPGSASTIQNMTLIFPNVSLPGSGGNLASGSKVHLGRFPAGTGIGWFLVSNGWTGSVVGNGNYTIFSNPTFNPEPNTAIRQHNVLINDSQRQRVVLGFEDVRRDNTPISCDQDFNDALFYITSNPYRAMQTENMPSTKQTGTDTDKDGAVDAFDSYPTDAQRAYNSYSPSAQTFGTLAFEDLWPGQGDYDLNDLVVGYQYNTVTNAQNKVVEIRSKFVVEAIGASFHNGFGVQLPIRTSEVANVSGNRLKHNYISVNGNGTEAGQDKATFIVFDDAFDCLPVTSSYSNTDMVQPKQKGDTLKLVISLASPMNLSALGAIPYNPFLIVNKQRGHEVHLPDQAPTAKADLTLFGTAEDATAPGQQRYYKTKNNLPFALHIPAKFEYPTEKTPITAAHLKFGTWAQSSGTQYADWYINGSQYRNTANVYSK